MRRVFLETLLYDVAKLYGVTIGQRCILVVADDLHKIKIVLCVEGYLERHKLIKKRSQRPNITF